MKYFLSHLQINIDPKNLKFYKDLMHKMEFDILMEGDDFVGYKTGAESMVFYIPAIKNKEGDYDTWGVNHVSFGAGSMDEVDKMTMWLEQNNSKALFETPRHRPEFARSENDTYYQVMFESPDGVLFEIVYMGKK